MAETKAANHALQRTRRGRRGCNRCVPRAGSGLCWVCFVLSDFWAALRAAQDSHNTWLSLRGAFHHHIADTGCRPG
jgi:hypothetical protein